MDQVPFSPGRADQDLVPAVHQLRFLISQVFQVFCFGICEVGHGQEVAAVQVIAQEFSLIVQDRKGISREEHAPDIVAGHFFDVVGFLRKVAHTDPLSVRHRQKTTGIIDDGGIQSVPHPHRQLRPVSRLQIQRKEPPASRVVTDREDGRISARTDDEAVCAVSPIFLGRSQAEGVLDDQLIPLNSQDVHFAVLHNIEFSIPEECVR